MASQEAIQPRLSSGAGLSLAIVRTILTEHRGAITMDSEPHHGARYLLKFPLCKSHMGETRDGANTPVEVVEDGPSSS